MSIWSRLLRIRPRGVVLFTHGVTEERKDGFVDGTQQPFDEFKENVLFFQRLDFDFLSMEELLSLAQTGFRYDRHWVHLTLDDGYANNYEKVRPFLAEHGIPWTLFVSTGHIERQERFYTHRIRCALVHTRKPVHLPAHEIRLDASASRAQRMEVARQITGTLKSVGKREALELMAAVDELLDPEEWTALGGRYRSDRVLSREQLQELANDSSVHVGSHNHDHIVLNCNVKRADIEYEMRRSKEWLAELTGKQVFTYGYPNGQRGDFTEISKEVCASLGYELAFKACGRSIRGRTDPMELPRVSLPACRRNLAKYLLPKPSTERVRRGVRALGLR